jgi:predicted Zn-dependent peptidase
MDFKKHTLDNGLAIIGEVNKEAQSSAVGFFVKTGSRDENREINGVSHFLEHMLFKGTERLSAFAVNEAFDRTGAKFNAFTGEENTVYWAAVLPEYLSEVIKLWTEMLRPALRKEDFEIEKNVIKEEIAMYLDLPHYDVLERCKELHFQGHPCGMSVLGTNESITNLTVEQMRDYFSNRYSPNNMVLVCAGNFEWEQLCSLGQEGCSHWQSRESSRNIEFLSGSKEKKREQKANLTREHICLFSPSVSQQDERLFGATLLAAIIGDDVGSRFYWQLVDKALAETATMQLGAMDGVGVFCSYIRCSPENAEKVNEVIKQILDEIAVNGVTESELQKAKNKVLSLLTIKNELPMGRLIDLGRNWLYLEKYRTIEDDIDLIKAVTLEDIRELIQEFKPWGFTQLSIGP